MPSTDELYTLRSALEEEHRHLTTQLSELGAGGAGMAFDENFADSGQVEAERGENRALAGQLSDTLAEVERALRKLDEGTYGTCEHCERPIGDARLEAMPASRYCIDCAQSR
jgi:DnaK suppressor protein